MLGGFTPMVDSAQGKNKRMTNGINQFLCKLVFF